jgi:hypothetical protein
MTTDNTGHWGRRIYVDGGAAYDSDTGTYLGPVSSDLEDEQEHVRAVEGEDGLWHYAEQGPAESSRPR